MSKYLLFLYDNPNQPELSPEEMQSIFEKYMAWNQELEAAGKLVSSEKLVDGEGRMLLHQGGNVRVLDGPYGETKEVIGGFFMIQAESFDEAVDIARGCPHVAIYGNPIEIRQVDEH